MGVMTETYRPGGPLVFWNSPEDITVIGSGSVLGDQDYDTGVQVHAANFEHYGIVGAPMPAIPAEMFDLPMLDGQTRAYMSAQFVPDPVDLDPGEVAPSLLRFGTLETGPSPTYAIDPSVYPDQLGAWYSDDFHPNSPAGFKDEFIAGTAYIFFGGVQPTSWTIFSDSYTWLYEFELNFFWYVPDAPLIAAPRRLYPRSDQKRLYPPAASRQAGRRLTGYY